MGIFHREKTTEELEEKLSKVRLEESIASSEANIAERKSVIAQLKKENGPGWAKFLGVKANTDTSTLKGFLVGAHSGLRKAARGNRNALSH